VSTRFADSPLATPASALAGGKDKPLRIALVAVQANAGPDAVPLGAACVASALKAAPDLSGRIELRLFEAACGAEASDALADRLAGQLAAFRPDLVGFSVYVWSRPCLARVASRAAAWPDRPLLCAGGPEAGADPEGLKSELGLDFVVAGEGEALMVEAARALARAKAEGCDPRAVAEALPRGGVEELPDVAALASPWLDGTLDPAARDGVLWELARGCPFACTFCYESRGRRGVRPLPMERLEAELELFRRSGVRQAFVLDPTFNANRKRALEMLRLIREKGGDCHWRFEVRAEFLDRELAQAFASLACSVQIGLQSAHPAVLAKVGRQLDRRDFARRIAWLNEAGVVFGFDLIYGLPGDSLEGFRQSLDWTLGLQPNHLDVFGLSALPGTRLADDAPGFGLECQPDAPYAVLSGPGFPAADMARAARLARAVDLFYNRGRAVPWFSPLVRALGLKPSAFLTEFAGWLGDRDAVGHRAAEELQLSFLPTLAWPVGQAGGGNLARLAADMVRLNGAWSRAWAEDEETRLELGWDPDRLMSPDAADLRAFVRQAEPWPCTVRVHAWKGRVKLERLRAGGRR
jgi:hypothetical protein